MLMGGAVPNQTVLLSSLPFPHVQPNAENSRLYAVWVVNRSWPGRHKTWET